MTDYGFRYAVLRYTHDQVTEEFVNVGVLIYSREARYLDAKVNQRYGRISDCFTSIDSNQYRRFVRFVAAEVSRLAEDISQPSLFRSLPDDVIEFADRLVPRDDSAFSFAVGGGGLSEDLASTLERLFERLVLRYESGEQALSRTDEQVWGAFEPSLSEYGIMSHLAPATVTTPTYEYRFQRTWRNEILHALEPVSLDLVRGGSLLEKANTWIGRGQLLCQSPSLGDLFLLLGKPSDDSLVKTYDNAVRNMGYGLTNRPVTFVQETDADAFAREFAERIRKHERH